jgi:tRNA pseudouridine38-40 synthase
MLRLAYDGTAYSGWQVQPGATTIQQRLQECLEQVLRHPVVAIGAGRTDAGVHALAQVAHFRTHKPVDRLQTSLNALLPPDIRVLEVSPAPGNFHARFSATGKHYRYVLDTREAHDPLRYKTALHTRYKLDLEQMRRGASHFVGTHDFTTFANRGGAAKSAIRTITRLDITEDDGLITLDFEGNGFLYKMVRNIVGMLLDIGRGKQPPEVVPTLLEARDRRRAPLSAPPQGLTLVRVAYSSDGAPRDRALPATAGSLAHTP